MALLKQYWLPFHSTLGFSSKAIFDWDSSRPAGVPYEYRVLPVNEISSDIHPTFDGWTELEGDLLRTLLAADKISQDI